MPNFSCVKCEPKDEEGKQSGRVYHKNHGTHPVDGVFYYKDPYLGKYIYLNTDFKSYAAQTINKNKIKSCLVSLAETISCANVSEEWKNKFCCIEADIEVRGLIFLYNHDYSYEKNIEDILSSISISDIHIDNEQYIHFLDPLTINRIYSMIRDIESFNFRHYSFHYPNKRLSKNVISNQINPPLPCTIESLHSPYIIIQYQSMEGENGYLIYYNELGKTKQEFLYFLDYITGVQIYFDKNLIIKATSQSLDDNATSNFEMAKQEYLMQWNYSDVIVENLKNLELEVVDQVIPSFITRIQGWNELA
ncbi:hypothetical protein QP020_03375 [Gallibacterium anatis]|uniref:hypothetical protein n=1 Tax=Gallibacterium anatis TaxID=750 RepID=UPI00254F1CFC|nr:hypothetical protein [Gallibacterium anatis]WIM85075.1 hypothetical protein QP020_03375 [Gallibacterium anatis]